MVKTDEPAMKWGSIHVSLVASLAESTKLLAQPFVGQSQLGEFDLEPFPVELGMAARTREVPDVDQLLNPEFLEQIDEFLECPGRMPDGVEDGFFRRTRPLL